MSIDIHKIQEFLAVIYPYMKVIMLATYMGIFLYINHIFVKDPILRKWLMASMEERDGKASGKSLTAFVFAKLIALATLAAIMYAPNHLLPEYFLISLLAFIGGLYGIKVASKRFGADGNISSSTTVNESTENTTTTTVTKKDNIVDNNNNLNTENKEIIKKDDKIVEEGDKG